MINEIHFLSVCISQEIKLKQSPYGWEKNILKIWFNEIYILPDIVVYDSDRYSCLIVNLFCSFYLMSVMGLSKNLIKLN